MPLYLPTSNRLESYLEAPLVKGQLYNLDSNEFIGFQFNPEGLKTKQAHKWSEVNWMGKPYSDLSYGGKGLKEFPLSLLYIAEPTAPPVKSRTDYVIMSDQSKPQTLDFDQIVAAFEGWLERRDDTGMPSQLQVIFGPRSYVGVVDDVEIEYSRFFRDLSVRTGKLTLLFKEWRPIK